MKKTFPLALLLSSLMLTACGTTNNYLAEKTKSVEMYQIFDIKTKAKRQQVATAASDGLGRNTNGAREYTPLVPGELPDKPGRFQLVDMASNLQGNPMAGLLQMAAMQNGGFGLKTVKCEGAVWTAKAVRDVSGSNRMNLDLCLFPYKEGYHLDMYATFQQQQGGLFQISRDLANAMVGTPEQWANKTLIDTVQSIAEHTGAKITRLEGEPELDNLPWLQGAAK
nr:hypothetical protein [uncultured Pseudogulbenkiania sp.]